jgi:uncharacterized protein (DUF934 family)
MRYIKDGAIAADPWVYIVGDEPVPPDVPSIVTPDWLFAASPEAISSRTAPLGAAWPNDKPESQLEPHLAQLSLIALEFPVFRDGRAYTQARRLRERYGFKGEIRATGDVLRDQFLFMVRAGFNAFEVRKEADAEAFAAALREFSVRYQPADGQFPTFRAHLYTASATRQQ